MNNDEAKQRAKNYMRLKGALERKQTAVDWLTEKLRIEFGFAFSNNILEQAKQMEKEQIIDACIYGPFEDLAEDFYNKTYG